MCINFPAGCQVRYHLLNYHAQRNVICGQAKEEAPEHFEWMCQGPEMDSTTFIPLLCTCNHVFLFVEGLFYFESMRSD